MHRLYFLLASFINTVVPAGALAQPCTGSESRGSQQAFESREPQAPFQPAESRTDIAL